MHMDYFIIAVHQQRGVIRSVRYILALDDSRIIYEKKIDDVIRDINSLICTVYTATRKQDDTYKKGSKVVVKRNYLATQANKRSGDNLDNLPNY